METPEKKGTPFDRAARFTQMPRPFLRCSHLDCLALRALLLRTCIPMHRDNQMAEELLQELETAPLDSRDQLLDTYSKVGLLFGNGNHCDIVCITFWYSTAPLEELRDKKSAYKVYFVTDEEAMNELYEQFYGLEQLIQSKLRLVPCTYLLVDWRSLMPEGDIRCY